MNLYEVVLGYNYNYKKEFMFYVVAKNVQGASDMAIETFSQYSYGDCHLESIELIASEGQYAEPNILLLTTNRGE